MDLEENIAERLVTQSIGEDIFALAAKIYPICRSLTGNGVRQTLGEIATYIPLEVHEVPTGTAVFDWTIPREWNIADAYIKDACGNKIVDFAKSNLHVMSYSTPVRTRLTLRELKKHIHSLPEYPDLIPYRTSYYTERWAFCMPHRLLETLNEETFEVVIESTLEDGSLTYGEFLYKGKSEEEFLFSAHVCHPSLANDNCSGVALLALLARRLAGLSTRFSYRFIFAPGTIGAITWLARNESKVKRIKYGLVVSMVGDGGGPTYKRSRQGNAGIDRAVSHVLRHSGLTPTILNFSPYGYDERQYCSPGIDLPVGLFQRSSFGSVPKYHTSADNLASISADHLQKSYSLLAATIDVIENDAFYRNTMPKCEPQLGKRGLYSDVNEDKDAAFKNMAMLWVLNLSDGTHSLLDIAEQADLPFGAICKAAKQLHAHGLLAAASADTNSGSP